MGKRFLLEGEIEEKVWLAIEFNDVDTSINLHIIAPQKGIETTLQGWTKGKADLPRVIETKKRTIADSTLLTEEIKVSNVGKVRQIEIEWGNSLIESKMLQSFDSEIELLKDRIMSLNDFDKQVFDDCGNFWKRVLDFKKENNISNQRVDSYKSDLDLLFEALKSLRKDSNKEFDQKSIVGKNALVEKLTLVEESLANEPRYNDLFNQLKAIRSEYIKTPMRQSHKKEIDTKINALFDQVKERRDKINSKKVDKRVSDLKGISEKMTKSLDWDKRELGKLEKDKEYAQQSFQLKLIDTKIEMVKSRITEKEAKLKNINSTYQTLLK